MSDDQSREIFREEALELLGELDSTLLELESQPHNLDLVNRAFRALHTIKGSGAMFGFDDIAEFTHDIENVFDKVRNEELPVTRELISITFSARDHITGLLNGPDEKGNGTPERSDIILAELRGLLAPKAVAEPEPAEAPAPESLSSEPASSQEAPAQSTVADPNVDAVGESAEPGESSEQGESAAPEEEDTGPGRYHLRIAPRTAKVDKELHLDPLFEQLRALGPCTVTLDGGGVPELSDLDPQSLYLAWDVDVTTTSGRSAIEDLFFFTDIDMDVDIRKIADDAPAFQPQHICKQAVDPDGGFRLPEPEPALILDLFEAEPAKPKKLGEILVEEGALLQEDLEDALKQQKPIGKILTDSGLVTVQQVEHAVARQQATREAPQAPKMPQKDAGTSLRVAADKLDTLVDLVGELVIVQAQISQVVSERGDPMLTALSEQLERLSAELRDSTLGIRMLPIGSTFSKFRRLVRDLSSELGKEIELVTRGEETELDKTVIERLGDPLVHLLRNSLDHGIEMPAERAAAGKKAQGIILLEAEHSGSEVLIRIMDDGKGMDPESIRRKAVEKGLITPEADLSEKETLSLIFLPGFSTAAQITNISGRGVGMDVVHRAIDSLRGSIELSSVLGQGTTITIRLPLTLAIIEGLQVQVGEGYFVIPLSLVEECVELHSKDVDPTRNQQIINLRGELVPYIHLRRWFEVEGAPPSIEQIVITGVEGRRVGIVVDRVIGEHQTVIKSLGRVYRDAEGISGATIRGDGTLALILDVPRLVRSVVAETV